MIDQMNIRKDYQWHGSIGFIEPGFQARKRKEKKRYPVTVFALLQKEIDTRTMARLSRTMARSGQTNSEKNPKTSGPQAGDIYKPLRGEQAI